MGDSKKKSAAIEPIRILVYPCLGYSSLVQQNKIIPIAEIGNAAALSVAKAADSGISATL